ncbi:MAG TPA: inositol monophosphatase family protein [Acidimicrobiales bacterium]|nr:inositol monophosphatase family protein [Acidimicrobiales bacterium]
MPSAPDPRALLDVAVTLAVEAGALLAGGRASARVDVATKTSGTDMVTEIDRASERLIADRLAELRPDDSLLGEEGAARTGTTGVCWVVDPLDGTTNYLYGFPAFTVSVAAEVDGVAVAGAVHDPVHGETFSAARGLGAWCDGRPLHVGGPPTLATALVATGFSYDAAQRGRQAAVLPRLLPAVRDIRRAGAASLDLCWVAAGRLDGYYETGLNPWDRAAGELVAREAGARVRELAPGGLIVAGPDLIDPLARLVLGDDA